MANEEEYGNRFVEGERSSLEGYQAYDIHCEKIGKVDDLFVDDDDRTRYVGMKTGLLGTKTTLIPIEIVRINDKRKLIEVEADKNAIKEGRTFGDDREITSEFEQRVLSYYRAEIEQASSTEREADTAHYPDATGDWRVDLRPGERLMETRGHSGEDRLSVARSGTGRESGDEFGSEDELRVQRVEEKLRADTREREAGDARVRKRLRTDRERLAVPKKRQEVRVERVPVEEGAAASEDEIGDDEIRIPVVEEEIVVEKRPVIKEEIRLRKEVVEEEEVVQEDVRKEEVDIDDQTERRNA